METQKTKSELAILNEIIRQLIIGIDNADTFDDLNSYTTFFDQAETRIKSAGERGRITENQCSTLLRQLTTLRGISNGKMKELMENFSASQTVTLYDQIINHIEKIAESINETTDVDELDTLRRNIVQIGESLMDRNIRSQLSQEEIINIEENVTNILRAISRKTELAEEIRNRQNSM